VSKLLSVSIPDELMDSTEELARRTGQTKSEVVREALRGHLRDTEWAEIFRYGESMAEAAGIGPADVEDLVDEVRAEIRAGVAAPSAVDELIDRALQRGRDA
jgi:metal-responsive CopG/Arc/MetJ family transcriptional regulator